MKTRLTKDGKPRICEAVVIFPPYVPTFYKRGWRATLGAIRHARKIPGSIVLLCNGGTVLAQF